jgi:hypothetical protein
MPTPRGTHQLVAQRPKVHYCFVFVIVVQTSQQKSPPMTSLPPMFGTFPAYNLFDAATAIVLGSAIKWITAAAWRVQQGEACGADAMTGHTVIADLVRFYGAGGGAGVVEDAGAKTTHMACLKRYLDTYLAMLI